LASEIVHIFSFVQAAPVRRSRKNSKSNSSFPHLEGIKIHHVEVGDVQVRNLWLTKGKKMINFLSRKKPCRYSNREKLLPWVNTQLNFLKFAESKEPIICTTVSSGTKKKIPRFLLIESGVLVIAEPDPRSTSKNPNSKTQQTPQPIGVVYVCNTIPLQNIEVGKLGFSC
jgi:hypothetical protein